MEGPKVLSEARGAGAPSGVGSGATEEFKKINVEIAYFSAFLQAKMVFFAVAARQD